MQQMIDVSKQLVVTADGMIVVLHAVPGPGHSAVFFGATDPDPETSVVPLAASTSAASRRESEPK